MDRKPHSRTHGRRERQRKRREEKRRAAVNKEGSEQWHTKTKFSTVL
jgi:hypothetical protein